MTWAACGLDIPAEAHAFQMHIYLPAGLEHCSEEKVQFFPLKLQRRPCAFYQVFS